MLLCVGQPALCVPDSYHRSQPTPRPRFEACFEQFPFVVHRRGLDYVLDREMVVDTTLVGTVLNGLVQVSGAFSQLYYPRNFTSQYVSQFLSRGPLPQGFTVR